MERARSGRRQSPNSGRRAGRRRGYYLAATLIFLDALVDWPDLRAWYLRQRRLVLGGLLGAHVASWIGQIALPLTHAAPRSTAPAAEPLREAISTVIGSRSSQA